jgi:predicted CoA-substrate-specific enzyme activase
MTDRKDCFAGIDVGASHTKAVILNSQGALLGYHVLKSGTDFSDSARKGLELAQESAGISASHIKATVSTGYGRRNVTFAQQFRTEIGCHARGCYHYFPKAMTIIDIGGQDNKIIKLDADGHRSSFKMNRKCAAGTGAFLEEMAMRLDIPLEEMDHLASRSTVQVELGSYCTVFSATEVLEKIRAGQQVEDIVRAIFLSVIKRVMEMDSLTELVVMSGGVVAHNPYLVKMFSTMIQKKVLLPPHPQLSGAIGAALFAKEVPE